MPDKQIVFRAMEKTRGQAAILATLLPLHTCPTDFWSFPLNLSLAKASRYPQSRQQEGQEGGDKAMSSLQ